MQRVPEQIEAQLVEDPEESPFYDVFADLPEQIPDAEQERLRQAALALIENEIVPAYRNFSRYCGDTYLPASRDSIGASELPYGEEFCEFRVRYYTTTQMTPETSRGGRLAA